MVEKMEFVKHKKRVFIDEELFQRIANGDDRAFEELYYNSYRPLYAFILSMTLNKEDAEDILQDTYVRIRGACHLYTPQGNPMAWIMKIAKNLYLMKVRAEKNKNTVDISDYDNELSFENMSMVEDRILIESLFGHLSEEDRNIIIMHVVMGMKHREIASFMNCQLSTVMSKYHRAMKLLKNKADLLEEKGAKKHV